MWLDGALYMKGCDTDFEMNYRDGAFLLIKFGETVDFYFFRWYLWEVADKIAADQNFN